MSSVKFPSQIFALPNHSKVWVYMSNHSFTEEEATALQNDADEFANSWDSHGIKLKAEIKVLFNQFVVIAVDETQKDASGCSIDKSVAFIKSQELKQGVNFFDRMLIPFVIEDKIILIKLSEIESKVKEGFITPETLMFDNLVNNLEKLKTDWIKPASESWLSRYF
jgi:hypothetical protein